MPDEYEEIKRVFQSWRGLRWIHFIKLVEVFLFEFALSCLMEWKIFRLYGFNSGLAASVRFFAEMLVYGIVMVPSIMLIWLLLLKALTLDSRKIGFRIGSFFGHRPDSDRVTNG